jgi:hypothetical protein
VGRGSVPRLNPKDRRPKDRRPTTYNSTAPGIRLALGEALRAPAPGEVKCHAGADHAAAHDHHFVRRRWDYFVRHLLGVEPPRNYRIGGEGG